MVFQRSLEALTSYRRPTGNTLKIWPSIRCTRWGPCPMWSQVVVRVASNLMARAKSHHLNYDTKILTVAKRSFKSWSNLEEILKSNTSSSSKTWASKTSRLLCQIKTYCRQYQHLLVHKMGSPMSRKASRQAALKQVPSRLSLHLNINVKDRERLVLTLKIQYVSQKNQKRIICYRC